MLLLQAASNFSYELTALRRSFRYNEYQEMEAPANPVARVSGSQYAIAAVAAVVADVCHSMCVSVWVGVESVG